MGEIQELIGEVREALQDWWDGLRKRHPQPIEFIPIPEPDNIEFTPLGPDGGASQSNNDGATETGHVNFICPITRQILKPGDKIYQCRVCGIHYSPEGWNFLQQVDKGHCCACQCRNSVVPLPPASPH